jgi:ribonuclease P protein subunit RPR2
LSGEPMESRKSLINAIAKERIEILFGLAEKTFQEDGKLAGSYLSIMNKISTHYKVGLPAHIKNRMCQGCSAMLMPGYSCSVIVVSSGGYIIYKCSECGSERHLNYKRD